MRLAFAAVLLASPLASAAPVPKGAEARAWVGKFAFVRSAEVQITRTDDGGTDTAAAVTNVAYQVVREESDRLEVRDGKGTAFLKKADAMRTAEAVDVLTKRLADNPKDGFALAGRGWAYLDQNALDKAEADYTAAMACPAMIVTTVSLRVTRAQIYNLRKKYAEAVTEYDALIKEFPTWEYGLRGRGTARVGQKRYAEAIADFTAAIDLNGTVAGHYTQRGLAYNRNGDFALAVKDYDKALELDPKDATAWNNLAWLQATCTDAKTRDGAKAVAAATKACELTDWSRPGFLDTLAAAYAEAGQFDAAVKWEGEAMRDKVYAETSGEDLKARLELYRTKKPYREPVGK